MRYSVEYDSAYGSYSEILEIQGHVATKYWTKDEDGTLRSNDKEFSEQFEGILDDDLCGAIDIDFDGSTLVSDIDDFIEINEVE